MSRQATIADLAERLGMHKSTVSLALSGKGTIAPQTRERVQRAAEEIGYEPNALAQRLARGPETDTVAIVSGLLDIGLATEKILLIQRALSDAGFEVPLYTCHDSTGANEERLTAQVRNICRQRPRAIICAAQRQHPAAYRELENYQKRGGIVVSYDSPVPLSCDQIVFDREENAYRAARHLLEAGHRRIGIGMSRPRTPESPTDPQAHRLRGFRRALAEFNVPFREEWFFQNPLYERGGAWMAQQFLALSDRPTGVTVVNDYVALAFVSTVLRAGVRIPQDLSVIGHDNQPIAEFCPVPLTTMTQPVEEIAEAVTTCLQARLSGDDCPPRIVPITSGLVERGSVTVGP